MADLLTCPWFIWLLVAAFALIVELCTTAMVSIWFVPSAVIVSLLSLICPITVVQVLVFLLLSGLFLWLFKKKFAAKLRRSESGKGLDPESELIGKVVTAASDITEVGGEVLSGDVYWRAVCTGGKRIEKGRLAVVTAVTGTTLTVEAK